jgi:nucleotide-binding universal stress UspA family protein
MKILLAVDGSACSTRAAKYVARHLDLFGKKATVTLLNLDPPLLERVAAHIGPEEIARYHAENGATAAQGAKRVLAKAHIPCRVKLLVGDPDGAIARIAKDDRCNLIVMGSHGHGALRGLILGSVVTKVLAQTTVPVLVVR